MTYLIEHYPTALKVLTFLMVLLNLACWAELDDMAKATWEQCQARTSSRPQALLQWLLRPLTLLTAILPMALCSFVQLGTLYELWSGNLPNALLLALSPLFSFLLHLLILGAGCLLLGLAE